MNGPENTTNIGSHAYDDTWIGEVISKNVKKTQKVRYFNWGKQGHLKGIVEKELLERIFFLDTVQTEGSGF